jgi:beta-glucosidase
MNIQNHSFLNAHMDWQRSDFPTNFEFGVATSAYQIEGSQFGGCGESHWDRYAAKSGNVVGNEHGGIACDHYNRWEEDLNLIQQLGVDSYRFSTSWARIMPYGKGQPNAKGLAFYDRLIDGMLARGISPNLTLYHWELPMTLADKGGWCNRDTAYRFADFSELICSRYGDRVDRFATINEPWCVSWLSHFLGLQAPGKTSLEAAALSMHHILLAHGLSIQAMRSLNQRNLGIVLNFEHAQPADDSERAILATERHDAIINRWFLEAITKKQYPEPALEGLGDYLPESYSEDMDIIGQPIDWLGINYYTRQLIAHEDGCGFPATKTVLGPRPKTAMDWEIYPEGLGQLLPRIAEQVGADMPLYITENGLATNEPIIDGRSQDGLRLDFFNQHLAEVKGAIDKGLNIKGYTAWSLMDNYEWSFGYDKRFGLIHIDFETLKRTPKASYYAWQKSMQS